MSLPDHATKTPIQQEEEIQQAIGECMLAWSEIEIQLCQIFGHLIEEETAYTVWDSVISFEAKLNSLSSVLYLKLKNEELLRIWPKLARRISKKAKKRNEIAHAALAENNQDQWTKMVLVPYLSFIKLEKQNYLTAKEIRERTASFHELMNCLNWFLFAAFPSETPSGQVRLQQVPDLILRFRNSDDQNPEES